MPRAVVPQFGPGQAVVPQALDSTNNHAVANWSPALSVPVRNTGGSPITVTIPHANNCPTCGAPTDKVFTIPAGDVMDVARVPASVYQQADGSLYVNPSATTGTIYAESQD